MQAIVAVMVLQDAVDAFRVEYNPKRPHQSLDMAFRGDRFTPRLIDEQLPLRLPPTYAVSVPAPRPKPSAESPKRSALPVPLVFSTSGAAQSTG